MLGYVGVYILGLSTWRGSKFLQNIMARVLNKEDVLCSVQAEYLQL